MYPKLQDLPEECIREIILRINDHRDLESSSAAWTLMAALASEQRVWRELTQFHFNQNQIDLIIEKQINGMDGSCVNNEPNGGMERRKDWQKIYHALRRYGDPENMYSQVSYPVRCNCRKYGIREDYQYSEILALCRFCCCLFWPSAGHPCIAQQSPDFRARLKDAAGADTVISEFQPVPPAQFLKYFSL